MKELFLSWILSSSGAVFMNLMGREFQKIQKISVIGNSAAGKTTLSRKIAPVLQLPLYHVDTIQFLAGMKIRPQVETISSLRKIQNQSQWIIEGYGPLDILEERLALSDCILYLDFPIWRHYFWALKRQLKIYFLKQKREELPEGCSESNWKQTAKLFKSIRTVHSKMRPELIRILSRENLVHRVVQIHSMKDLDQFYSDLSRFN